MAQSIEPPIDPLIKIISWSPQATWTFKATSHECQICRETLVNSCTNCLANHNQGELICNVSKGNCGHCFHKHCIDQWLSNHSNCPICSIPLNISVKNMNNDDDWKKIKPVNSK